MVTMGNQRSKEDDVHNISTSVFVTNFPDQFGAKDLWYSCKAYGQVVDVYIPNRRSKSGKRFGFMRFIKVFDVERLISNLCTIWVGRFKLHANVARFLREPMNKQKDKVNANGMSKVNVVSRKNGDGSKRFVNSYVHAVTGYQGNKEPMDNIPTMVLDETCLNNEEYSLSLLGKVKEFASLTNLKLVLAKEGFSSIEIKYMGGFWVMIVFQNEETKNRFQSNVAVGSWFSQIIQAHNDFNLEERVMWVEIEGVPCKWWSKNTFRRIASRWGIMLNRDELEEGGLYSNKFCVCTKMKTVLMESFKMVYCGKVCWVRAIEIPGWIPDFEEDSDVETNDDSYEDEVQEINSGHQNNLEGDSDIEVVPETCIEDESNKKFIDENFVRQSEPQSEDPFGIYKVLKKKVNVCNNGSLSEESRKYPPGFTPNDVVDSPVNDQDDALENNSIRNGKENGGLVEKQSWGKNAGCTDTYESMCSGHFKKSSAPRTGGSIVQLIDELVTVGQTMGYNMTGCLDQKAKKDWVKELYVSNKVNFVSLQETKMVSIDLWGIKRCWGNFDFDYVYSEVVGTWLPSGKRLLVISVYAPQELRDKKMLWDYLVTVICNWDGEVVVMGDFNENDYINLMKKLRFLKEKIRKWNCVYKESKKCGMRNLKVKLNSLDSVIDKGDSTYMVLNRRMEVIRLMQEMEKVDNLEVAQKAKIKWAIEGDENSKYYHGVLNKKRSRLTIRGVLADGIWIEPPHLVKKEFFIHFKQRFEQPNHQDIRLEMDFVNRLSLDQKDALESEVSDDEVRNAVWDCGVDKTPGPDGFTFGFYRRYWKLIERDVIKAVKWFFLHGSIPNGGNASFITLIPKIPNASMVKDFRPISLIGSIYKIVAKKRNKQAMVFKVDFEKAYDSVRWDFVEDILRKFGFGDKWCTWIRSCLQSSRVMESLHISFQRVVDAGLFKGIKLGSFLQMPHLFYADDAIFMGQWNQSNIDTITQVLDVFYRASGLRINMHKSKLMGISVDANLVKQAASKIGCMVLKTPFKYLGSRVGDLRSRIQSWCNISDFHVLYDSLMSTIYFSPTRVYF
ncbi:RNA-directed DNA polymerase, eukaryota [Tanacetum coccineum]